MTQGHDSTGGAWPGPDGGQPAAPGSWSPPPEPASWSGAGQPEAGQPGPARQPETTSWAGGAPWGGAAPSWAPWSPEPAQQTQPTSAWHGDPAAQWAGVPGVPPGDAVPPAVPDATGSATRRSRRLVLAGVAVLALLVGGGVGAGIGAGVADDQDRVDALSGDVDGLRDQLADSDTALDAAQARAEDAEAAVDGAVDEARAQVEEENAEQAADLDAREADLAAREAAVSQRESAAGALEQQAADGSIPGDGVYLVGTEVAPGTYRATSAGEYCYWERLSGLSGEFDDVITNGLGAADATVTVSGSDVAFSSDGCGSWQRIS